MSGSPPPTLGLGGSVCDRKKDNKPLFLKTAKYRSHHLWLSLPETTSAMVIIT